MKQETKDKLKSITDGWQNLTEQKAKASSGWAKVAWILACIACAVAGYFLSACTASYSQSAAGDIAFSATIVQPAELQK